MPGKKVAALQPQGLHNLRAYNLGKELAHLIYDITIQFPAREYSSLQKKKADGAWDRTYQTLKEEPEPYDFHSITEEENFDG